MIAWILGIALVGSLICNWINRYLYKIADDSRVEGNDYIHQLLGSNGVLQEELKPKGRQYCFAHEAEAFAQVGHENRSFSIKKDLESAELRNEWRRERRTRAV